MCNLKLKKMPHGHSETKFIHYIAHNTSDRLKLTSITELPNQAHNSLLLNGTSLGVQMADDNIMRVLLFEEDVWIFRRKECGLTSLSIAKVIWRRDRNPEPGKNSHHEWFQGVFQLQKDHRQPSTTLHIYITTRSTRLDIQRRIEHANSRLGASIVIIRPQRIPQIIINMYILIMKK